MLVSADFWDVKPFRWLTMFWKNQVPLSSEQTKTVATFSPGMLVTVYQITQLTVQKSAAAHGLKDDFAFCGSQ